MGGFLCSRSEEWVGIIEAEHRRGQDFLWGCTLFFSLKVDDLFTRRPQFTD